MAKQKIVVKVSLQSAKDRSKAMRTVVGVSGVETAALQGDDKNQIAVIGEGIDSIELTTSLRKKFGYADLLTVGPDEKKEEKKEEKKDTPVPVVCPPVWPPVFTPIYQEPDPNCCIM
ncbi:PREDICTED: uncharacterized protein LOC104589819 [Nelumbo nucifera]|uniref:Uncharacterized protein LOC104589819 n=1 Tax=Nelumbo nucifera TaxID=4432 RepID=A0A1U7ZEW8_NELNU|nr:PREDICTED: uncharacterized protein LOC104589819 [Nelumbo nucifera]